jgi:hypothetical protein
MAEKEYSSDESILLAADSQFFVHCQRGESDVISVKNSNYEEQKDERDDPSPQFADHAGLD